MIDRCESRVFGVVSTRSTIGDSLKCFVHVLDADHYCRRVNTIEDYLGANQDVAKSFDSRYLSDNNLTANSLD